MVTAPSGEQNDDQDVTRIKDEPHSAPAFDFLTYLSDPESHS